MKPQSIAEAKQQVLQRYVKDYIVYKRFSGEAMLVTRKNQEELNKDYGPNHKPWVRQLVEAGWLLTDEDPTKYVEVRCWWGTAGSGWDRVDVIKHTITHHSWPKGAAI